MIMPYTAVFVAPPAMGSASVQQKTGLKTPNSMPKQKKT